VLELTFEYLGRDSSRDYPLRKGVLALIEMRMSRIPLRKPII